MISVLGRRTADPKARVARSGLHKRLVNQFINGAPRKNNSKSSAVVSLAEANSPIDKDGSQTLL